MAIPPGAPGSGPQIGTSNAYPPSECTWWADERYHQLTGAFVPWSANASGWLAGAMASGWGYSALPPSGIASIIVLQPGVQGADTHFGHVGIVESVNPDGSVYTSDLNWGTTPSARAGVQFVTFQLGAGVSFVFLASATSPAPGGILPGGIGSIGAALAGLQGHLQPGDSLAQTLVGLDTALALINPFDTTLNNVTQDSAFGLTFDDPASWLLAVTTNIGFDAIAALARTLFLLIGGFILIKVAGAFIDYQQISQTAQGGFQSLGGMFSSSGRGAAATSAGAGGASLGEEAALAAAAA